MATVGLISCVSRKRSETSVASELYVSPLFRKARAFVENRCDKWYILSAKYGLVEPRQLIDPYEETLNTESPSVRRRWGQMVWTQLRHKLCVGDHIFMLAGRRYREYLMPEMVRYGCVVEVPLKGLGIGRQLQWLSHQMLPSKRLQYLDRLYRALRRLEEGVGGKRKMSECTGKQRWPNSGIYFFFEPGEQRRHLEVPRVVRVGTHGVSCGSRATLWNRLRAHRGTGNNGGNHRSSIFRLHIGAALAGRDSGLIVPSWGAGKPASVELRQKEERLEQAVSRYIGGMSILWLAIGDKAGPTSDRAYLERNLIGLLAGKSDPADPPSKGWLGHFSPNERIQQCGLWNLNFLDYAYSNEFLDLLDKYIDITIENNAIAKT